ncbi:hypothetical protein D9758_010774 [Tetrapyrgos nigripes]|uniref:CCHC-type domain-containing protein n=1 Tax=Tetrapyrgos nigripes TaxID=182062 RepID=A0A8H5D691_9AGAR|nr:hypothetical protein D9758_010774 [Tetrapyrgos nigripes]
MSEHSHSIYHIDPLQGADDYSVWKVKMLDILTDLGLDPYMEKPRQSLTTPPKAKKAKEAWTTLKNLYEAAGAIGVVSTQWNFFCAQCDNGGNIVEHIQTMHSHQAELAKLGHAISASDFSITLLTSLPRSWNAFIGSIDLSSFSDAADPDSSKIIARILEEDRCLHDQSEPGNHVLTVKPQGKLKCYLCDKIGHLIQDCPKKKAFTWWWANRASDTDTY